MIEADITDLPGGIRDAQFDSRTFFQQWDKVGLHLLPPVHFTVL